MPTVVLEPPSKDKEKSETNSNSSTNKEEEEDDPVTSAIKKTGCYPLHEKLQLCYFDKKDWRACSNEMQEFRLCMQKASRTENQQAKK